MRGKYTQGLLKSGCRILLVIALLETAFADDFSEWSDSMWIVLNTSGTGADVSGSVSDFPVLIRLNPGNFAFFSQTEPGGSDIRFASSGGTHLSYSIERWDDNGGNLDSAWIWVNTDVTGNSSSQYIVMYWGKTGAADSSNSEAVFETSNGFQGVWHLAGTSSTVPDATANGYSLTRAADVAQAAGLIGYCQTFDGAGDYMYNGSVTSPDFGTLFTVSVWVYTTSTHPGGLLSYDDGDGSWETQETQFFFGNKSTDANQEGRYPTLVGHGRGFMTSSNAISSGAWQYVTYVFNSSGPVHAIYINGELKLLSRETYSGGTDPGTVLTVGAELSDEVYSEFDGEMDELRIENTNRSADWIKLCYENQKSGQTLVEFNGLYSDFTWDTEPTGGIQPANGTWGTNNYWTATGSGGTSLTAWPGAGKSATFGGSDGSYTITVSGTQDVDSLSFLNSGYTLSTGIIDFGTEGSIFLGSGVSSTISAEITGSGGLDISSTGSLSTLNLSGTSTYTGVTTIRPTVRCNVSTLADGGANCAIGAASNAAASIVLDGGQFRYTGSGASIDRLFTLGTTNTCVYSSGSGAWNFTSTGSVAFTGSGSRTIEFGGGYSGSNTFAPVIGDGPGGATSVDKTGGDCTWIFTGDNTYTGTTTINDGTLQLGNGGTSGSIAGPIVNNSNLIVDRSDAYTVDEAISGTGTVTKNGSGTLILSTADFTYTGTTTVNDGTLRIGTGGTLVEFVSDISNGGAVVFDRDGSMSYTGDISGTGTVAKEGVGSVTFTGSHSYTGVTTVSEGTLILTGTLASGSSVAVETGASFAGTGSCGPVTVSGGNVAPGVSGAGKFSTGDLSFNSSATLDFDLGTESDTIAVDGDLTIDGTIDISSLAGFATGTYRLLTVTGTITDHTLSVGSTPAGFACTIEVGTDYVSAEVTISIITENPSDVAVTAGEDASFSVTASGSGALTYEWFKEPSTSVGGDNATLDLSEVAGADSGRYRCIVEDDNGIDTSEWATLTVVYPAQITVQPPADTSAFIGSNIEFEVTATGSIPLTYKWYKDLSTDSLVDSGSTGTYEITDISFSDSGSYYCVVSNAGGSATSGTVGLHVLHVPPSDADVQPNLRSVLPDETAQFTVSSSGTEPFTYAWYKVREGSDSLLTFTADTLKIEDVGSPDSGYFYCIVSNPGGADTSDTVQLAIGLLPPTDADIEPDSLNVSIGDAALFTAVTSGTEPFTYEWYVVRDDDEELLSSDSASLLFSSVEIDDEGDYYYIVTNAEGSDTSDTVQLVVREIPPSGADIQPNSVSSFIGDDAEFIVSVSAGTTPLTFSWYKGIDSDDDSLLSAGSESLSFENIAFADSGTFYCVVSNPEGADTSDTVHLTVRHIPPSGSDIEPDTLNSAIGDSIRFVVTTDGGTEPFSYEWHKIIGDSDSALENVGETLDLVSVASGDGGRYFCVVTNSSGSDTSDTALLFVGEPVPVAGFSIEPKSGQAPLEVEFTDKSVNQISSRLWDFGDDNVSTAVNPSHTYTEAGLYTVTLVVSGPGGTDSLVKEDSVFVYAEGQNPVRVSARYLHGTEVEITLTNITSIDTSSPTPQCDSLGVWISPGKLPFDGSDGTVVKRYPKSAFSDSAIIDTILFPDVADSVFGIMTGLYWDDMSVSEFLTVNGCLILLRDTTSPSNNLNISATPLGYDSVRLTLSNIGSVNVTETDSFSIWYGKDTTNISMTGSHTIWYAFDDLAGDDEESLVIDDTLFTGFSRVMFAAVTLKGVEGRFSPPVITAFTTLNSVPDNPLELEVEAVSSTSILLTWNSLDDTSFSDIRVWYGTTSIDTGLITPTAEYETISLVPDTSSLLVGGLEVATRHYFGIQVKKDGFWSGITDKSRADCSTLHPDSVPSDLNTIFIDSLYYDSISAAIRITWCVDSPQVNEDVDVGIGYSLKQYPADSKEIDYITVFSRCTDTLVPLKEPLRFDTLYYVALWLRTGDGKVLNPTDDSRDTVRIGSVFRQAVTFFDTSSVNDTVIAFNGAVLLWKDSTFTDRSISNDTLEIVTPDYPPEGMMIAGTSFLFRKADPVLPFFIGIRIDSLPEGFTINDVRMYDISGNAVTVLRQTVTDSAHNVIYVNTSDLRQIFVAMIDTMSPDIAVLSDTSSFILSTEELTDSIRIIDNISNLEWEYFYGKGDQIPQLRESGECDSTSSSFSLTISNDMQVISSEYGLRAYIIINDGVHYDTVNISRIVLREESDEMTTESNVWVPLCATADLLDKKAESLVARLSGDENIYYDQCQMRLFRWITYTGNTKTEDKWVEFAPEEKSVLSLFTLEPGRLFWLKTRKNEPLHLDSGYTLSLKDTFDVSLPSEQWTDFGMPFRFSVFIDDIREASGEAADSVFIYKWVKGTPDDIFTCEPYFVPGLPDKHEPLTTLDYLPKGGYCFYNSRSKNVTLRIPPTLSSMSSNRLLSKRTGTGEWSIKIIASTQSGRRIPPLYCGYAPGIVKSVYPAPPSFSDVRLYVSDRKSGRRYGHHIGEEQKDGLAKELLFCNNGRSPETVSFYLQPTGPLPESFQAYLFNPKTGELDSSGSFLLKAQSKESRWIITGDASYRQQFLRSVLPLKYTLHRIYPNPARSTVHIRYTVPLGAEEQLRIFIFNVRGQKVWKKKINGLLTEGTHLITWDGLDEHGHVTGSGMYIIRLQVLTTGGGVERYFDRILTYMK